MKNIVVISAFVLLMIQVKAQDYELISENLSFPKLVATLGSDVYFISDDHLLKKLNTITIPTLKEDISKSNNEGEFMYASPSGDGLVKVSITADTAISKLVYLSPNYPNKIIRKANEHKGYIYFLEYSSEIIYRVDTTSFGQVEIVTANAPNLRGFTFQGNDMYLLTDYRNSNPYEILKVDLSVNNLPLSYTHVANVVSNPYGLSSDGTYLYYGGGNSDNLLLRVDPNQGNPTEETLVSGLNPFIISTFYDDGMMYFAVTGDGEGFIGRLNTLTIGLEENAEEEVKPIVFPNPATDELIFSDSEKKKAFQIFSISGKLKMEGEIPTNAKLDIRHLSKGVYLVKIKGNKTARIVK
jgi:hypothetical protein